ncbi:hypothetical protein Hanom_Chr04g00313941 [Helianthus anomalus]
MSFGKLGLCCLWRYEFHHCWTRSGSDQFMEAYCEIPCYFNKDGVPVQGNPFL